MPYEMPEDDWLIYTIGLLGSFILIILVLFGSN